MCEDDWLHDDRDSDRPLLADGKTTLRFRYFSTRTTSFRSPGLDLFKDVVSSKDSQVCLVHYRWKLAKSLWEDRRVSNFWTIA